MKYLPTKQYRIVPGSGLAYRNHDNVSTNWPKIHCSQKFYPPKNTHYMVDGTYEGITTTEMNSPNTPESRVQ